MIIGVMSDTHGNLRLMHQAADQMKALHQADLIIHVGDDYADAQALAMAGHNVRMVPGLWCDAYNNPRIPNRIVVECDGITISAAHADKDLRAAELSATIVLTGHTHVAKIEKLGRSLHVNPGHLKNAKLDRGQRPSFAVIETSKDEIEVSILELDSVVRLSVRSSRADLA
ncbi:MAG: YfcE family phosphodiesterase [Candidatus Hydrogenedentes bacterium]|nr:YfcE family phosphodiesterase [Candidatus Hydrogenedentota bacterium]